MPEVVKLWMDGNVIWRADLPELDVPRVVHISIRGDDANDGTRDRPLRTVKAGLREHPARLLIERESEWDEPLGGW